MNLVLLFLLAACMPPSGTDTGEKDTGAPDTADTADTADTVDTVDTTCLQVWYTDGDGDGYGAEVYGSACDQPAGTASQDGDCDDTNAAVNPDATEVPDGIDNNCDGTIDTSCTDGKDDDGDGWVDTEDPDCLIGDEAGFGTTGCNDGLDNDSSGYADAEDAKCADAWASESGCPDADGDGSACDDCNDADATINPAAAEIPDGRDNDCNGLVDEGGKIDNDGDGYDADADCDDSDASVHPGAKETIDGIDNDCNGIVDG